MVHNHVLTEHTIFRLTPIDYHRPFISYSTMILSCTNRNTFSLQNIDRSLINVVFYYLICAFSYLTLSIEHKTTSKNKKFALILNRRVALTTLDILLRCEANFFPWYWIAHNLRTSNIFDWFIVHSSYHVEWVTALSYCCTLTRRRNPSFTCWLNTDFCSETFALLHALNITLKTSGKFFG